MSTSTQLSFRNRNTFYKIQNILLDNGYQKNTSMISGNGYFEIDENWLTIKFKTALEISILPLLETLEFSIKRTQPIEYKILNQGGYID
jgi:hypothetical protein